MAGVKRGEIWIARFDPAQGNEIKKTRPAVILQNDVSNEHSPVTIVAPLTTNIERCYPNEALITSTLMPSKILLNQIRSIDKRRLVKRIGAVSTEEQRKIDEALKISLGMD